MRKLLTVLASLTLVFGLVGCSGGKETSDNVLKVSATLDPHAKILEAAAPILEEYYGIELEVEVLDDYYIFNKALDAGEVDANYFQHVPFFNGEVEANGYDIVNVAGIHIEPFGFYSKTVKSINDLPNNAEIVISNSISDHGRILAILDKAGVISLKDGVNALDATTADIVANPKNVKFTEVKPELLTLAYENGEGDVVAINGNYAIQAGLNPTTDAVLLEQADSTNPYVNIVACKAGNENSEKIKALVEVLKSNEIKTFITSTYADGSVIPAE